MKRSHTGLGALALVLAFAVPFVLVTTSRTEAYNLEGCKWAGDSLDITYKSDIVFSADQSAFQNAIHDWNGTPAKILFAAPATGQHVDIVALSANNSSVAWDGLTTYYCQGGYFSDTASTNVQINHYFTQNYTSNETESVAGHELGHALGLAHNSGPYLMDPNTSDRYGKYGVYTPQADDIQGAEALYGSI